MRRLQSEQLREFTGALIAEMMEFKQPIALATYAQRWLKLFPEAEDAPDVAGAMLRAYPSADSVKTAAFYLTEVSNYDNLFSIFRACFEIPFNEKLYGIIETLIERHPEAKIWGRVLFRLDMTRHTSIDKFALRWLQLNKNNPKLEVSLIALFSSSPEVLDGIMDWIETTGRNERYLEISLELLYRSAWRVYKSLLPRIAATGRRALKGKHSDEEIARIFATIVRASGETDDIEAAKEWFETHRRSERVWTILVAILEVNERMKLEPDKFAVNEAKIFLRNVPPKTIPSLVGALVCAHPDPESVSLAKKTYEETQLTWILETLVDVAFDDEIQVLALESLRQMNGADYAHDLLSSLLRIDPKNEEVVEFANSWIQKNPLHKSLSKIQSLLAA